MMNPELSPNVNAATDEQAFAGPRWDNSTEYKSLNAPELEADLSEIKDLARRFKELAPKVEARIPDADALTAADTALLDAVCETMKLSERMEVLMSSLETFAHCELSVDGSLGEARKLNGTLQMLEAEVQESATPVDQLLLKCSDAFLNELCKRDVIKPHEFKLRRDRWFKPHLLSLSEETLITRLDLTGFKAWSNLYDNVSSSLQCKVQTRDGEKTMGIARAGGLVQSAHEDERRNAYKAINDAWKTQSETCASVLNSLAGWRVDLCARRSQKTPLHFLDDPLKRARIRRETLDAMLAAVDASVEIGRRAVHLKARALKKSQLGPWDLFAPAPELAQGSTRRRTFGEGLDLVASAFSSVHPDMGAFAKLMAEKRWIEGSIGDKKRPGAYCTKFYKSRNPRVYMTYRGTNNDIGTLAHELGHAFHNWVMRDLHLAQTVYPMTLAETASTFAETVVSDHMAAACNSPAELLPVLWDDLGSAEAFVLNIPVRFRFEKAFYEQRSSRVFNPEDFNALMAESWRHYYGDTLSEMNEQFWCSKLHFHKSSISFYNFPYTFGYLFSLGIYAQRQVLGDKFYPAYVALLRDTGTMEAEDLAARHLHVDLSKPDFWNGSLSIVSKSLDRFEQVLGDCGL